MNKTLGMLALGLIASLVPANAALIFDNSSRGDFQSGRGPEFSPLAAITVSTNVDISQIGAMVDLNSDGNMRFLIFNLDTNALLLATPSAPYTDTGLAFQVSPVFSTFTLTPGITYGIGAIADVGGGWEINNSSGGNPFTQNNITSSDDLNSNVTNFASPGISGGGTAMIMVQLFGPDATTPEPASLALVGLGVVSLIVLRKRTAKPNVP